MSDEVKVVVGVVVGILGVTFAVCVLSIGMERGFGNLPACLWHGNNSHQCREASQ